MPEQLFAQPEDILKQPEVSYMIVGKTKYVSYTPTKQAETHYLEAAAGIAAAFLGFRLLMSIGLNEQNVRQRQAADEAVQKIQDLVMPQFMVYAEPHVHMAASVVNNKIEENYAQAYAEQLGKYLSETSSQAFLEGYTAAVNAGIDKARAWEIAANGYGLDSNQMRQYVMAAIKEHGELKPGYDTKDKLKPSDVLLQKLIDYRAARIGENEAFAAAQLSTIVSYQASQYRGELDSGLRRWETAQDERVCAVCGPLDGVEVDMFEPFVVNGKYVWAPGVHPNCRCSVSILYPSVVSKAMGDDPYNRDKEGQFSRVESRRVISLDREAATEVINDLKQVTQPSVFTPVESSVFTPAKAQTKSAFETSVFTPETTGVFTSTETSVFTPQKTSVFTNTESSVFTPMQQRNAVIIVNGIQMRRKTKAEAETGVETEVETDLGGPEVDEPYFNNHDLWLYGTHIISEFDRRGGDLRIGSVIDFDQVTPIDQDTRTGTPLHFGYHYAGVGNIDPRALAFTGGNAQNYMSAQNDLYEDPALSSQDSINYQAAYDILDNEMAGMDIGDLLQFYGSGRDRKIHIWENYLDEKGDDSSLDNITLAKFRRLSEDEMEDAIISASYLGPEDDKAMKMAFMYYVQGDIPEHVKAGMAVYSEGSSMSGRELETLFKFQGYNGFMVETDMGIDGGEVTGKYEVVDIELESGIRPQDIEEANLYMNGNPEMVPDEWRVVTVRPIGDYDTGRSSDEYEPPNDYRIKF